MSDVERGDPDPSPETPGREPDAVRTDEEEALMGLVNDVLTAGPGLVRLMAGVSWRVTSWAVTSSRTVAERLVRAALQGESVAHLSSEAIDALRSQALELLGFVEEEPADPSTPTPPSPEYLRERGRRLLEASADVHHDQPAHPAYHRILDELAPDEGRILRLLRHEGPQPSVDVRTSGTPVTQIGSELVAPGLTMIGSHAGVRHLDRVPAYLNNLFRLGLIWFSREPVDDLVRYQVLEAQPDVAAALKQAGRGRTIRRSIHITPFGQDFCDTCLLPEEPPLEPC